MSVRPITVSEEKKATGHPWVNIFALFGALQGTLTFLHSQRVPFRSNWFAHPGSLPRFLLLSAGGFVGGGFTAMALFTDWELFRLYKSHRIDAQLLIEGQKTPMRGFQS